MIYILIDILKRSQFVSVYKTNFRLDLFGPFILSQKCRFNPIVLVRISVHFCAAIKNALPDENILKYNIHHKYLNCPIRAWRQPIKL